MDKKNLVIFVKEPVPGKVKTRLVPPLTPEKAADLYRVWAREIYTKASLLQNVQVSIAYEPLGENRAPDWLGDGEAVSYFLQKGADIGERMRRAFEKSFKEGFDSVVLVGSDSPGLPLENIQQAFDHLLAKDLILGPTLDGGYYLIGLKNKFPEGLFDGVEWSTEKVLNQTLANAKNLNLHLSLLPKYFDIDRPEDLARYLLPKISVIIPVYNEEASIAGSLRFFRDTAQGIPIEMIVVNGNSTDRTKEKAAGVADHVIDCPISSRGMQMHLGAQKAAGIILLFVHADTELPKDWAKTLMDVFQRDRPPAAAAFELEFDNPGIAFKIIAGLARLRNRITGVPQGDQGLAVRKDAYFMCGGFPNVPLMEEYFILPKLRRQGKIKMISDRVKTSARKYERVGPFKNALMNIGMLCLFYAGVSTEKLALMYRRR